MNEGHDFGMSDALDTRWSKESEILSGAPDAMPKRIRELEATNAAQRARIVALEKEVLIARNLADMASSLMEEHKTANATLAAERDRLKEALEKHSHCHEEF